MSYKPLVGEECEEMRDPRLLWGIFRDPWV